MRKEFTQRWNRRPSDQLTQSFVRDLETIHKFLIEAEKSNKKVRGEWEANRIKLKVLSASRASIESRLPSVNQEAKTETSETLRILLDAVSGQLDRKTKLVKEMETTMNSINIIPILVANKDKNAEQIYTQELSKFDTYTKQIEDLNKQQEEILASVTQASEAFEKTRVNKNEDTIIRTNIIQEINVGVQLFNKLLSNFNEGSRFYKDLMGQRIQPLKQRIDDFVFARNEEKKMVLEQLHKDLQSFRDQEAALAAALHNAGIGVPPAGGSAASASAPSAPLGPTGFYAQMPVAHPIPPASSAPPPAESYSAYQPYTPASSVASAPAFNPYYQQPASAPPSSTPVTASSASLYQPYAPTSSSSSVNPFLAAATPISPPGANPFFTPAPTTNPYASASGAAVPASSHSPSSAPSSSSEYSSVSSSGGYPSVGTTTGSAAAGSSSGTTASSNQWSCSSCTYLNDKSEKKCVMCDAAAPAGASAGGSASDEEKKKKGLFGLFGRK